MKSFITKAKNLYKMDTGEKSELNFQEDRRHLVIPKYQREYQWTKEMVETLLLDIKDSKKFLGIIILEQKNDSYEVVDGQQRLTTFFLVLAELFNYYDGEPLEQEAIENLIKPYGQLVLENQSVGEYLIRNGSCYDLSISEEGDIYYQKETFHATWQIIKDFLDKMNGFEEARSFKNKMYNCEFLVLINDQTEQDGSVEQVFLDINEKSQLLDPAAIFKGHCFEIFEKEHHESLKQKWVEVKRIAKRFELNFKYRDTSWFLYMYLLGEGNIKEDLSLPNGGRHYLHGKTMDRASRLLDSLISYGKNNVDFYDECKRIDYYFDTVCVESLQHRNTPEPRMLAKMSQVLLECASSTAQYQKIPFMYFISMRDKYKNDITHDQTKRIVSNLYTYATLFALSPDRKSKADMDRTVIEYFKTGGPITKLVEITKELRKEKVNSFYMISNGNKFEKLADIYTIMDFYDVSKGILQSYYSREEKYNLEHLIQNDNDSVEWAVGKKIQFTFNEDKVKARERKKKTINYVLINEDLNGSLRSFDIVTKVERIKEWHNEKKMKMPVHLSIFINSIEGLETYQELVSLKNSGSTDEEEIISKYREFFEAYYDSSYEQELLTLLTKALQKSFVQ